MLTFWHNPRWHPDWATLAEVESIISAYRELDDTFAEKVCKASQGSGRNAIPATLHSIIRKFLLELAAPSARITQWEEFSGNLWKNAPLRLVAKT